MEDEERFINSSNNPSRQHFDRNIKLLMTTKSRAAVQKSFKSKTERKQTNWLDSKQNKRFCFYHFYLRTCKGAENKHRDKKTKRTDGKRESQTVTDDVLSQHTHTNIQMIAINLSQCVITEARPLRNNSPQHTNTHTVIQKDTRDTCSPVLPLLTNHQFCL